MVYEIVVQIGTSHRTKGADHAFESIHNIKEALPELWETTEQCENVRYSREIAIEQPVQAQAIFKSSEMLRATFITGNHMADVFSFLFM